MRTTYVALLLFCATLTASATTLYNQLCAFNFNWKKYPMQAPTGPAQHFSGDKELIQAHLASVLVILRGAPTDQLTTDQKISRAHMITLLDGYRAAGRFPVNYYRAERIPVFIDEHGTHCAVGYLMMMSGHDDMAQRISRDDNYVWVKDLHDAGVPAWQNASGLSFEELALIQGAYDWYPENSYYLANRYETPQQPKCTTAYFGGLKKNVWCCGEGKNGVLNGKWTQNYSAGLPWIEGHYTYGKRSGEWKEYYQGTNLLCRTERWFNDKLNGTRTRYDRSGHVIEEILFSEGVAVSKINYEADSTAYVRIPIDSNHVVTQVYNSKGKLIACGREVVYNPGNLLWFQSIELTALNSAQITTRNEAQGQGGLNAEGVVPLYNQPALVEYKKEGDWLYFQDTMPGFANLRGGNWTRYNVLHYTFQHFGPELYYSTTMFNDQQMVRYDSVAVTYKTGHLTDFYGYSPSGYAHLHIDYRIKTGPVFNLYPRWGLRSSNDETQEVWTVKEAGQYNNRDQRMGQWKYYNESGQLYKTEEYLVPQDEEVEESTAGK